RNNGDGSFGVDLNRNYGYMWGFDNTGSSPTPSSETYRGTSPFSEPETQAIRDFCNSHQIQLTFNYHTYGDLLIYPWGYLPNFLTPDSTLYITLAMDMTQFNNYTYGTGDQTVGYLVNGDSDDWMYGEQTTKGKIIAFTPEVGPSFWPSPSQIYPLALENIYPNMVLAMGPGVIVADSLDPNPPANFTVYSDYATPTSIQLNWDDPTSFASGDTLLPAEFNIQIRRDGNIIDSVNGGVESYLDAGLNDGQEYFYSIFAKVIATDSVSEEVGASWHAGGAPTPAAPSGLFITESGADLMMHWSNPAVNVDSTPMDDFAGINLYEDGSLVATYIRATTDTGRVDSALYSPAAGTHQYYVTAIDNESPANESAASNTAYSPIAIPFFDDFAVAGVPNPGFWLNENGEVTSNGVNPPSTPNALQLDGHPNGGDRVNILPVDLSGMAGQGLILSFWYQPAGNGNDPETGDSLTVDFLNNLGQWKNVRRWPGTPVQPFVNEVIAIDNENPGAGATFFHPGFQFSVTP
ncbi:MAG: M14 family zinc carboxypeptidase, partial [Calditrichia bacterium]